MSAPGGVVALDVVGDHPVHEGVMARDPDPCGVLQRTDGRLLVAVVGVVGEAAGLLDLALDDRLDVPLRLVAVEVRA